MVDLFTIGFLGRRPRIENIFSLALTSTEHIEITPNHAHFRPHQIVGVLLPKGPPIGPEVSFYLLQPFHR